MNQDIGMTLMIENSAPPGWILTGRDMIFPADELTKHHRTPGPDGTYFGCSPVKARVSRREEAGSTLTVM